MPFNGTGTFTRIYSWQTDQANGVYVRADRMDTDSNDIATGLSNCITKDGQQTVTANIPFAGYKITGLGTGAAATDAVNFAQVFTAPSFTGGITVAGGLTVSSGTVTMTSATSVLAPTPAAGDNSNKISTTAFAVGLAFAAALPAQATHADNVITTDGATASWTPNLKATVVRFKDGTDATKLMAFSLAGLTTLTTRTVTIPDKNGTMAMTSDLPVTFTSADQTITSAGSLTLAHSLGAIPKFIQAYLRCVTIDNGYAVGDILCIALGMLDTQANNYGISVVPDATNLNIRFGSAATVFAANSKTSGISGSLTNAKWSLFLKAQV